LHLGNSIYVNNHLPKSAKTISKIYFGLWKTPGVSERMSSVNLEVAISGEYQTLGGCSGRTSEELGTLTTGTEVTAICAD
jgi:hypothetical protein